MHNYVFVSKKNERVKQEYATIRKILQKAQNIIRKDFDIKFHSVGSYARNMITYEPNSNIGYDFDFNAEVFDDAWENYKPKAIKRIVREAINKVATEYGYANAEDSTRVLTIKKKDTKKSKILHSFDVAIVINYEDDNGYDCQDYIHFAKKKKLYNWCEQSHSFYTLDDKIGWIKDNDIPWNYVREYYLEKKNKNDNPDMHSRQIYAQTIHEICQKYGYYDE